MDKLAHQFDVAAKKDEEAEEKFTGGKGVTLPSEYQSLPGLTEEGKIEKSRRAAAGRAKLLAKRGPTGHKQTPAELVPVRNCPQCGVKAP